MNMIVKPKVSIRKIHFKLGSKTINEVILDRGYRGSKNK